jgi:hypothetical protein
MTLRATEIHAVDMHQFRWWDSIPASWAQVGQVETLGVYALPTHVCAPAWVQVAETACP